MPGALPLGDPAPADGMLPGQAAVGSIDRGFGLYVHIPFCAVRCGYCDFNTYTATELGGGASQDQYASTACGEIALAQKVLAGSGVHPRMLDTVFFGGGTPTLLDTEDLTSVLASAIDTWGLSPGAEVTTEANPDSVTPEALTALAAAGFTRVSFGMQSVQPHVLKVLDRTHSPERVPQAVRWARDVGLSVSVDLIYGTPGESLSDWESSLDAALSYSPDHISAYALIVEEGTKLAGQIRRGEVPGVDDDDHADKYLLAEQKLQAAGMQWYEVSNWARSESEECRHNLAYWRGEDWWGIGPGAHSHIGGVRWWNVKHPSAYATRLAAGESPAAGRETLDERTRNVEDIMLRTRLSEGLPIDGLDANARKHVPELIAEELVDGKSAIRGSIVLTLRGRLLADAVVRRLSPDDD